MFRGLVTIGHVRIEVLGELQVRHDDGEVRRLGGSLLAGHVLLLLAQTTKTVTYDRLEAWVADVLLSGLADEHELPDQRDPDWRQRVYEAKSACVDELFRGDPSPITTRARVGYKLVRGQTSHGTSVSVDWDDFTRLPKNPQRDEARAALALVRGRLFADEPRSLEHLVGLRDRFEEQCSKLVALVADLPVTEARDVVAEFMERPVGTLLSFAAARFAAVSPDEPHQAEGAALRRLQRLSQIGRRDAESLGSVVDDDGEERTRYMTDGLWVPRRAEGEVVQRLTEGAVVTALAGEPGTGKTSLLAHIGRQIESTDLGVPLFVKAPALLQSSIEGPTIAPAQVTVDQVLAACAEIAERGRRPVVLLDTADVLLAADAGRDLVIELLESLGAADARVVVASRPQEVGAIRGIFDARVEIGQYDDKEIVDALESHVRTYYDDDARAAREVHRISDLLSHGEPVGEVLRSPLAMRVTFELYAPHQIPSELNGFELYRQFWLWRVSHDRRAEHGAPLDQSDLSTAAERVAAVMLSQGSPEISPAATTGFVRPGQIERLVKRGVLARDEDARIRFFHQTFFEHAAGRWFASQTSATFKSLVDRFVSNPQDLFRAPVVEQALLHRCAADPAAANTLLTELADHDNAVGASATFVFGLVDNPPPDLLFRVRSQLAGAPSGAMAKRYLGVARVVPKARIPEAAETLVQLWNAGGNSVREDALTALCSLASRDPGRVAPRLDDLDLVNLARSTGHETIRMLDRYFTARGICASRTTTAFWERSDAELRTLARHKEPSLVLHAASAYVAALAVDSPAFRSAHDTLREIVVSFPRASQKLKIEFARLAGGMGARAPRGESAPPLPDDLSQQTEAEARFRLAEIGARVAREGVAEPSTAIRYWLDLPEQLRFMWSEEVWTPLLRDKQDRPGRDDVLVALGRELATSQRSSTRVLARTTLLAAKLTGDEILTVAQVDPVFSSPDPWIDHGWAGELLVPAAMAGVQAARTVLADVVAAPRRFEPKLSYVVRERILEIAQGDSGSAATFVGLCLARDELNILANTFGQLAPIDDATTTRLIRRVQYDSELRDPERRRDAYKLRATLHKSGVIAPDAWSWLSERIKRERAKPDVLKHLVKCAVRSHQRSPFEARDAVESLRTMVGLANGSDHPSVRDAAQKAAATIAGVSINELDMHEALDAFLSEPVRVDKVAQAGYALDKLPDPRSRKELVIALFTDPRVLTMAAAGRRGISARLRRPMRRLFDALGHDERAELLLQAPTFDDQVSRCIVEAATSHYPTLREEFAIVLTSSTGARPTLAQLVTHAIEKSGHATAHWPELLDVLRAQPG